VTTFSLDRKIFPWEKRGHYSPGNVPSLTGGGNIASDHGGEGCWLLFAGSRKEKKASAKTRTASVWGGFKKKLSQWGGVFVGENQPLEKGGVGFGRT